MANGFAIPVRAGKSGGAEITRGINQTSKILISALSESDDDNPFQDVGIRNIFNFKIDNNVTLAEAKIEVERILAKFTDRIQLKSNQPLRFVRDSQNNPGIEIAFVDLETGREDEFVNFVNRPGQN